MTLLRRILLGLGWGTVAIVVAVFLFGYAAPHLSPARFWWTDLVAVFLGPLSLAVVGLALLLGTDGILRRRWGRVVLSTVLLVLLTIRFAPRLAAWGASGGSNGDLRVMSFNVPHLFKREQTASARLIRLVQGERPHILAFQESRFRTGPASSQPALEHVSPSIRRLLDDSIGYAPPQALPPNVEIQQPVLGRLPLDSMSVHSLPPRGSTDARSRYTRTQFEWKGHTAVLYNVHLHTVGRVRPWRTMAKGWLSVDRWRTFLETYRESTLRRAQQARLIRRQIERESEPVIVVGDFNSTPHQWAYRHIAQGLKNAASRRIRGWSGTFPAQRPLVRIDHVLVGPAWQVVDAHVPALEDDNAISDHRPVVARVKWKGDWVH